ncbi:hypothetical protein [Streptomyces sp. NPDC092307]|uniref:hypothetical protein n=1 Tax=Streptomyces sp. NPDC092307 TaxID=3366013 RepID=UPI00382DE60A
MATALIGFCSATARSHPRSDSGSPAGGSYASEGIVLVAAANGIVAACVAEEPAKAARARSLPGGEAEEQRGRTTWLASRPAAGAYPWPAAARTGGGPVPGAGLDMDEVLDRTMSRLPVAGAGEARPTLRREGGLEGGGE